RHRPRRARPHLRAVLHHLGRWARHGPGPRRGSGRRARARGGGAGDLARPRGEPLHGALPGETGRGGGGMRGLLVIEGDGAGGGFLCESLNERGYHATGSSSPLAALERIRTEAFDIVVTDVEMPELRGPELLSKVLAERPQQLVLVITAFGSID